MSKLDRESVGYAVSVDFCIRNDATEAIRKDVMMTAKELPITLSSSWWVETLRLGADVTSDMIKVRAGDFSGWEADIPKVRMTVLIVGGQPDNKVSDNIKAILFGYFAQGFFRNPSLGRDNFAIALGWISNVMAVGAVDGEPFER